MALPAGRYGVTKNQLLKVKKLPMNTIKLIEDLYEKYSLLGSAAFKNSTSVVTESSDLVESGAVKNAIVGTVGWIGGRNLLDPSILTQDGSMLYSPIYVGSNVVTLSTTAPKTLNNSAVIFLIEGNVSSGASTEINGAWDGQIRTVTPVNGYVTIASRKWDEVDIRDYNSQLEVGSTATAYEPYHASVSDSLAEKCDNTVIAPTENGTTASQAYAVGTHAIRNGAFITWKNAKAQGETINDASDYTSGDVASEFEKYIHNTININNLSNLPLGLGVATFDSTISPSGVSLVASYICFGNNDDKTVIIYRIGNTSLYVNRLYNGSWSGWVSIQGTPIS